MVRALYAKMIEREHGDLTNSSLVAGSPPSFFTSTSTPEYGDMRLQNMVIWAGRIW